MPNKDGVVTMNTSSRYWNLWRINPAAGNIGYKKILMHNAQKFVNNQMSEVEIKNAHNLLFSYFNAKNTSSDIINSALAGLCLRCYVSEPILKECRKIDSLFSGDKQFTYRDLLPFVLNDDGQKLIVLDKNRKTQLMVDDKSQTKKLKYNLFSVTVLQTFNPELQSRMSLDNWAYLQTKQNPELKKFLSEFGFKHLSDWALLNRAGKKQFKYLLPEQDCIIEAFHAVYRRDRQQQKVRSSKKCPDPTNAQLQEMLVYLQQHQIGIDTPLRLMKELKQIALQLRQYDIWNSRESLDIYDAENGVYVTRCDLPGDFIDEVDVEQEEFLQFFHEHLNSILAEAIKQEAEARIQKLQKSKKYAPFAQKYIQGLKLYYCEAMSLKDIAPKLEMTSWDQARRVLNPGELLSKVRAKTVEKMLEIILKKAAEKGLTKIPPEANYLIMLTEQIESYVDSDIFKEAAEEIRTGKNRTMSSAYAEQIRSYIRECTLN